MPKIDTRIVFTQKEVASLMKRVLAEEVKAIIPDLPLSSEISFKVIDCGEEVIFSFNWNSEEDEYEETGNELDPQSDKICLIVKTREKSEKATTTTRRRRR